MIPSLVFATALFNQTPILSFDQAKSALIDHVYHDNLVTTYCGCTFTKYARSGGRVDHDSCGYEIKGLRADAELRAARVEWEHIFPVSRITEGRPCGNRSECRDSDEYYGIIEGDMHNLTPTVGEVNAMRSNYQFQVINNISYNEQFGQCNMKIDRRQRAAEPPNEQKGFIARTYKYISWAYGVPLSEEKQRLFMAWHEQYPASDWEIERNNRIARIQGWHNPFITGDEQWSSIKFNFTAAVGLYADGRNAPNEAGNGEYPNEGGGQPAFIGNKNSGIYFPKGCQWYDRIAQRNRVPFASSEEAQRSGFRAARNC